MQRFGATIVRRAVVLLAATTLGMLASTGVATAANYTVNDPTDAALATSSDTNCVSTNGGGSCTLRAAVQAADNVGGASTIMVPAGTFTLSISPSCAGSGCDANDPSQGDLDVNNSASVTISGAGSGSTIIDANSVDRAFAVQIGAALALSGVTIENGNPSTNSSGSRDGGAIWSDGALTITGDVVFDANSALGYLAAGGAIYADSDSGSSVSISGATFERSASVGSGGAIFLHQPGTASIANSAFNHNSAGSSGGAVYGDNGGVNVDSSSFTANNAGSGGAIYWDNSTPVTVTNSSFTANTAGSGGALDDNSSSTMTLGSDRFVGNVAGGGEGGALFLDATNTTATTLNGDEFDDNSAAVDGGAVTWYLGTLSSSGSSFINNDGGQNGGGLYLASGKALSLTNATISDNHAIDGGGIYYSTGTPTSLTNDTIAYNSASSTGGGGIFDPFDYATTASGATGVLNTIVADNTGGDCGNGSGTSQFPSAVDAGFNLDSDSSCFGGLGVTGDKPGVNPLLADAADNGGPVLTDRELAGSPAIDAGTNSGCPATDARGVTRPQTAADRCDIGSYESVPAGLSVSNTAPAGGTTGIPFTYTIEVTAGGPGPSTGTTVTDQLPAGETLYGANPSQGSCSSSGSPAKVTCALGTINVSKKATVTLSVAEANPGSVTDTATATNDEGANVSAPATTHLAAPVAPAGATAPTAITGGHSHVTKHSANVSGSVSTGGQSTWYFFQYGTTRSLGLASGFFRLTSPGNVAATIHRLLAGKKYFYRLVAINDNGVSLGTEHSFRTKKNHHP